MKLQVHTIRFGNPDWLAACAPTLDRWCSIQQHPLYVWDNSYGLQTPKLIVLKMLDFFLKSDSTHFLYVDADVYVNPHAPDFPWGNGIALTTDAHHQVHNDHFREWVAEHYGDEVPANWNYVSAGVWCVDRAGAKELLATMRSVRFVEFFQEQHWFNWCVIASRIPTRIISSEWNFPGKDSGEAYFYHLWGNEKLQDLNKLKEAGLTEAAPAPPAKLISSVKSARSKKTVVLEFIQDGGLGNQMFEWAAGYSIAKSLGMNFRWVWKQSGLREFGLASFGIAYPKHEKVPLVLSRAGQGSRRLYDLAKTRVEQSTNPVVGISCPFQDEQCFIDHADDIAKQFMPGEIELPIPEGAAPIGVQVRRGDYLKHSRLNVTTPDYFTNGMRMIREQIPNAHFIVVSDDPAWCEQFFGYREDVTVMPPQTPYEGIRTLASCRGHVISNSTFGWWGAWLGERRYGGPVVVPELWHHGGKSYGQWEPVPARWLRASLGPRRKVATVEVATPVLASDAPRHPRAIVYPWHAGQEVWHELRYSLRSVHKHFADTECPIYILGTQKPGWLIEGRVRYIGAYTYKEALMKGVQIADEVLWMNDDIVFVRDTDWEDCRKTLFLKEIAPDFLERHGGQTNPWREGVLRVLRALAGEGIRKQRVYSTHTPYVYERAKAMEILRKYGVWDKFPMELAYFHHHAVNPVQVTDEKAERLPIGNARYLCYSDRTLTVQMKQEIASRFPEVPPWELDLNYGL